MSLSSSVPSAPVDEGDNSDGGSADGGIRQLLRGRDGEEEKDEVRRRRATLAEAAAVVGLEEEEGGEGGGRDEVFYLEVEVLLRGRTTAWSFVDGAIFRDMSYDFIDEDGDGDKGGRGKFASLLTAYDVDATGEGGGGSSSSSSSLLGYFDSVASVRSVREGGWGSKADEEENGEGEDGHGVRVGDGKSHSGVDVEVDADEGKSFESLSEAGDGNDDDSNDGGFFERNKLGVMIALVVVNVALVTSIVLLYLHLRETLQR